MKKLVLLATLTVVAVANADSYMYWLADTDQYAGRSDVSARVVAIDSSKGGWEFAWDNNYLSVFTVGGTETGDTTLKLNTSDPVEAWANLASFDSSAWTYYVELWGDQGIFAHSEAIIYNPDTIYASSEMETVDLAVVGGFVPAGVPEPTSGLLLLIGCAGLALRRRRLVKA